MQTACRNFLAVTASSSDHVYPVINKHLNQLLEAHCDGLSINESDRIDVERVLHGCEFKELFQDCLRRKGTLTFDHKI